MLVDVNDFQKRLLVRSLDFLTSTLPTPPPNAPPNPMDSVNDLVRNEAVILIALLNGPGELKAVQNTFRTQTDSARTSTQ